MIHLISFPRLIFDNIYQYVYRRISVLSGRSIPMFYADKPSYLGKDYNRLTILELVTPQQKHHLCRL